MRYRLLLLLAVISLAFAPAPFPKADRRGGGGDLARLQGEWVLVSRLFEGRPTSHVGATVRVEGDRWTSLSADGGWRASGTLTLDTGKAPRHLDWGPGRHRGVYEISGDTLVFVFTTGDDEIRDLDGHKPRRYREVLQRARR